ncbi:hypothetical protein ACHAWX_005972 [Stephanocyclus meneghinianus]
MLVFSTATKSRCMYSRLHLCRHHRETNSNSCRYRGRLTYTQNRIRNSRYCTDSSKTRLSNNNRHDDTSLEGASMQPDAQSTTPKWRQVIPSLTLVASRLAKESAEEASEVAKTAASKASGKMSNSIQDFKAYAKESSAEYASDARRSMNSIGARVKASAAHNLQMTRDRMKESILNTRDRLKNEISHRISKVSLPFMRSLPPSAETSPGEISKSLSYNTKEALQSLSQSTSNAATFATKVLTQSTTNAASNMTSQMQQSVTKASRWIWWWGLAAVGVYGMSTTLTKEGMQLLKDMINSPKSDEPLDASGTSRVSARSSSSASQSTRDGRSGEAAKLSWFSSIREYFTRNEKTND